MKNLLLLFVIPFSLPACITFYQKIPEPAVKGFPSKFSLYKIEPDRNTPWWNDFKSMELNRLMDEALKENFNVKEAWARLLQAQSQTIKVNADTLPDILANAGQTHTTDKNKDVDLQENDIWSLGLSASYEIDLWGRIQAEKKSARLKTKATRQEVNATVLTITGQIAETWINILSEKKQKALLEEQITINRQLLELIELRFSQSMATALDVYQQRQTIAVIYASRIMVEAKFSLFTHQLANLLGRPPKSDLGLKQESFPIIAPVPKTGIPSDLMAFRPDIRMEGLRLKAANWEIAAARADRLPKLKLTASYTYSSDEISSLFDNWLLNLAGNLVGPIFDGKQRKAEVDRTKAVVDERLATYKNTVLNALKEIEDALTKEQQFKEGLKNIEKQISLSEKTFNEAKHRYLNGLSDYLPALRERLNIAALEKEKIKTKAELIISRIKLYKALGASWTDHLTPHKTN